MYSLNDEQVQEMVEISRPLIKNIEVEKVANSAEFERVVLRMRLEGITPVVFFNNKNDKLFDKSIDSYGITNILTCNSYKITEKTFFVSTNFIGIKNAVSSLSKTNKANLFDFYASFCNNYAAMVRADNNRLITTVAVTSVFTLGGIEIIVYYNTKEP